MNKKANSVAFYYLMRDSPQYSKKMIVPP